MFLPSHAPLVAFGTACGNWSVWTQTRATATLGGVVALAGLSATEYVLHILRIEGIIFLLAGGASAHVEQKEGRWKSDAYKVYVGSHEVDAEAMLEMLADADAQPTL